MIIKHTVAARKIEYHTTYKIKCFYGYNKFYRQIVLFQDKIQSVVESFRLIVYPTMDY
jgi:hypothetical protein